MLIKVKDNSDLVRDDKSTAILNINSEELLAYKTRKKRDQMLTSLVEDNKNLKEELSSIKLLLVKLLENNR